MIIVIHNNHMVSSIVNKQFQPVSNVVLNKSITKTVWQLAEAFPEDLIIWCHEAYKDLINVSELDAIFHHKRVLATFNPTTADYLPEQIGYIERSYYLKVNKEVSFPTWKMSPLIGGVHAQVLLNLKKELPRSSKFGYVLISLAKRAMVEGLFCYSEPKLLKKDTSTSLKTKNANNYELFKFVKQHYKWVWVFFLFASYVIYEKRFPLLPLLKSFFYRQLNYQFNLEAIPIKSTKKVVENKQIDVVIPTIGRKKYLYDVLKDFAMQTLLPKNIIIVEQNPDKTGSSDLDYLTNKSWPFNIKHTFTHQTGVCNARNVALGQIESEWAFLADDDIRFDRNLLKNSLLEAEKYGVTVLNYLCLQPHQKQTYFKTSQTTVFGSGSSMVKSSSIKAHKFNMAYEFGFGEDSEFGMQLRNSGDDVIFFPNLKITHLKAPIGGYRTKVKKLWDDDIRNYKNRWAQSVYWSKKLQEKINA